MHKILDYFLWNLKGMPSVPARKVLYISEGVDWVIDRIGNYVLRQWENKKFPFIIDTSAAFYTGSLIHFGSLPAFASNFKSARKGMNTLVATVFHGNYGIDKNMDMNIALLKQYEPNLAKIIVANSIMRSRLLSWGIPEGKIDMIPIGVDLEHFHPGTGKRGAGRRALGLDEETVCIGSFQKDGNGWEEGLEPKWVKGPDVFVAAVRKIAAKKKVVCLLTGPSRGYVKKALQQAGIPFIHRYFNNLSQVADFYRCLDIYLVTSREEGGPEAIMESMACGVPVVSTKVGMAVDLIKHGENGFLAEIDDPENIAEKALVVLSDKGIKERFIKEGQKTVGKYDWKKVVDYYKKVYGQLLS